MNKDVLRRLGWTEELIDVMSQSTKFRPARRAISVGRGAIDVQVGAVGASDIDISSSPAVASSALPPPRARRQK